MSEGSADRRPGGRSWLDRPRRGLAQAAETGRAGLRAPAEELLVAGLIVAPFAATFGIWLSWLTWWPSAVICFAVALSLAAGAAWVGGHRMEGTQE